MTHLTDLVMHAVGVASLGVFAGAGAVAVATIVSEIDEHGHRIRAALRGPASRPKPAPRALSRKIPS